MQASSYHYGTDVPTTLHRAIDTGARLGWRITYVNEAAGVVTFNTGRSFRTWGGQNVSITVVPAGTAPDAGSWLTFNATLATNLQFTAYGEARKMRKAFVKAMGR